MGMAGSAWSKGTLPPRRWEVGNPQGLWGAPEWELCLLSPSMDVHPCVPAWHRGRALGNAEGLHSPGRDSGCSAGGSQDTLPDTF